MTSITRTVTVRLDPAAAFDVFTSEIDTWYPRGPYSFNYPDRTVGIEIEVRFEPVPGGTRVTLEHRGWDRLPPEKLREWAGRAWKGFVAAFVRYVQTSGTARGAETMTETAIDRQAVIPMVDYADGPAAMDWLAKAFGFVERTRWLDDDGRLSHGEMLASGELIMMATPDPAYEGPRAHREHCARAAAWSDNPYVVDGVLVHVDDVDAHHAQAAQAGARILSEPEDAPYGRLYRVEDIEGHRWMFLQPPAD